MNKILFSIAVGALIAFNSFGQGTVNFSNSSLDIVSPPDRLVRYDASAASINPAYTAGSRVFSNGTAGLRAQLYFGASTANESSLVAVSAAPTTFRGSTSANVGTWIGGGSRALDGFSSGTVNLQVRVWDINLASSYEAATALGAAYAGLLGTSLIFQYTIPTDPLAPLSAFNMNAFQGFNIGTVVIPEPSTIVLAGLGAAALLIFRRRK